MLSQEWAPLPRCCARHDDYSTLTDHLIREFAELAPDAVAREVLSARRAVGGFGLGGVDGVDTAELICRYQLSLLSRRFDDVARLDPQSHPSRSRHAVAGG